MVCPPSERGGPTVGLGEREGVREKREAQKKKERKKEINRLGGPTVGPPSKRGGPTETHGCGTRRGGPTVETTGRAHGRTDLGAHGSPAIAAGRAHGWRQRAIGKRRLPRWVLGGRGRLRCARHGAGALPSRVRRVGPHRLALRLHASVPAFLRSREGGPTVGLFEREREGHRAWVRVHVRCTRDGEGVGVFAGMA